MLNEISKGVSLNTIHENKFKTITIKVDLIAPLNTENFAKRALLTELLETNNQDYPTQTKLAQQLSKMYGASFGTNILRYGNLSIIRINLIIPNPKYIPGRPNLLKSAFKFLKSVIFNPLSDGKKFDDDTFNLQKSNIQKYIKSLVDDKQYYSSIKLKELFYKDDPKRGKFLFGKTNQYDDITSNNEYDYYLDVIKNNNINFSILGEFNDDDIIKYINSMNILSRQNTYFIDKYIHNSSNLQKIIENSKSTQSNLNLAYKLPIYYDDEDFFAALIFNAVFGGTPQSKLFKNVREKYSMAYYANSTYNALNGVLIVNSGIDAINANKVQTIIDEQLNSIKVGKIDLDLLNSIKAEMINAKKSILDNPRQILEQSFVNILLSREINFDQWCERINKVTVEQIAQVAKKVKLQTSFLLKGDK
ncbi:insulinase family protein [Apilactobacillus apisilvae]|uniref:Insulinase family protein n=1 Tax=Apilactobacillus apisilvae TaxID=2923364 RepID=A0ABY4PIE2_9LACO|nr:insulinase family protein [Apilactobacillus apisilvae]UQS85182.1 insulinase family protein [Apilactobacillus apisilvae]